MELTLIPGSDDENDVEKADEVDEEDVVHLRKKKRKSDKRAGKSPFASLEDYEHLLNKDSAEKPTKSRKKRKSSN